MGFGLTIFTEDRSTHILNLPEKLTYSLCFSVDKGGTSLLFPFFCSA